MTEKEKTIKTIIKLLNDTNDMELIYLVLSILVSAGD